MQATRPDEFVSPSLLLLSLLPTAELKPLSPDFDLGMADWLSDSTVPRPPQRKRLRLTRARSGGTTPLGESTNGQSNSRFSKPVDSPERLKAAKGVVPANTESSTQWAVKNFTDWALNRSTLGICEAVPADLLKSHDAELVCKWLCRFIVETRKTNGSVYPPATLKSLVSGVNRVLQGNKAPFSVLDKSDPRFRDLLKTLDSVSSELHRQGIGATKQSAKVIDPVHEDIFWQKSLLGYSTPKALQRSVFFYAGLHFVLRGVQEQHNLLPSQFVRVPKDVSIYNASVYYEYIELVSKNNQHRFKDINSTNKTTCAYALPGSERCVVKLLDMYLGLLPPTAPFFYMRTLDNFPADPTKSCFTKQRIGTNILKNMLPELSEKSGVGMRYTNHSLRATAITRMFNNGIPEKVIAETSGHRSIKALRCYEHTSEEQKQAVTAVINSSHALEKQQLQLQLQPQKEQQQLQPQKEQQQLQPQKEQQQLQQPQKEQQQLQQPQKQQPQQPDAPVAKEEPVVTPGFSGNFSNCTINISMK